MGTTPFLNHVEMAYKPGQREAARAFFQTLGFHVIDTGAFLTIYVDPGDLSNWADNILYASEAIPAQQTVEEELLKAVETTPSLAAALEHYKNVRHAHPQFTFHFGFSIPTHDEWESRVARVKEAAASHELLAGHLDVMVFEEDSKDAISNQSQCFVRADFLVAEGYPFGLEMELQFTPLGADGKPNATQTGYYPTVDELS